VRQLAGARNLDLLDSARFMALIAVAKSDAFVAVFDAKYHYDFRAGEGLGSGSGHCGHSIVARLRGLSGPAGFPHLSPPLVQVHSGLIP